MPPRKILIVDDSKLMHKMLSVMLQKFKLVHAQDGLDALQKLGTDPLVDLILLDINMPRMSGLELLVKLKEDPMLSEIPVVIVSTEGTEEDTLRGLEQGAAAYVRKPFDNQILQQVISQLSTPAPAVA
jgi:CheY-like chemotaxis protein